MRMIFVNLPVKDLMASRGFFAELGFEFNPQFSDDNAACMIVDENIFVMLLVEERFRDFINDEIADGDGRRPHVRRELPGSRRSRLGADAHRAGVAAEDRLAARIASTDALRGGPLRPAASLMCPACGRGCSSAPSGGEQGTGWERLTATGRQHRPTRRPLTWCESDGHGTWTTVRAGEES